MTTTNSLASCLRLRIDAQALAANWRALDALSGEAKAAAAVKANAYGLGAQWVVPTLYQAGARHFYVAHWQEAEAIAPLVDPRGISVLHGPVDAEEAAFAMGLGVRPVINSVEQAQLWIAAGNGPCDVMVDTGMNRLGLSPQDYGHDAVRQLQVETLLSHLVSADEESELSAKQLQLFREAAAVIPAKARSLANSAGIALGSEYHFDETRPGLALYGGIPRPELAGVIRQVAYPQVRVLQTRELQKGDTAGYNALFTAQKTMRTATLALGYADGFLRSWPQGAPFAFQGVKLPLIGRVSMDMVIVDCSDAPEICVGDWVDVPYDMAQSAACGLSQYEMLTQLGGRFDRFLD